jgi:hypothetical protein
LQRRRIARSDGCSAALAQRARRASEIRRHRDRRDCAVRLGRGRVREPTHRLLQSVGPAVVASLAPHVSEPT